MLAPPPQQLDYRSPDGDGEFILSVGRLDRAKRVDLLLEAAALDGSSPRRRGGRRAGPGAPRAPERRSTASTAASRSPAGWRTTSSSTSTPECLAVFYAPFDEDFGFVPYEAFLSEKPVVTTRDAGGPLEVVVDRRERPRLRAGSRPPSPQRARGSPRTPSRPARAAAPASRRPSAITWDAVVDRLLGS